MPDRCRRAMLIDHQRDCRPRFARPLFWACWLSCLCAATNGAEPASVSIGFEGRLKVGRWTPVIVTANDQRARTCEVVATDPDGVRVAYPLNAERDSEPRRWSGIVRTGRLDADLEILLHDETGAIVAQQRHSPRPEAAHPIDVMRQSMQFWLEIGIGNSPLSDSANVRVLHASTCPDSVALKHSLDAVDGIWISSTTVLGSQQGSARDEIVRWVSQGGHLVLAVTLDATEFDQTYWAQMLRDVVRVQRRVRTNDLTGIESFVTQSRRIPGGGRALVTILSPLEGRVLVNCAEGALITRSAIGFGQVTVLGVDLNTAPLSRWDGRTSLCHKVMFREHASEQARSAESSRLSQSGITDLASQWRAASIELPGLSRPSLWSVLGLLLLYGAVIGPLDYLITHRVLKRPQWTWATLPVLVIGAVLGMAWLARAVNSESPQLCQLDVLDLDAARNTLRATSVSTTYSPESRMTNVAVRPTAGLTEHARATETRLSWLGFPENASGGMYRSSGFDFGELASRTSADRDALTGLPIRQWATKSFVAETSGALTAPLIEVDLTSTGGGNLSGRVVHHFPSELLDWVIAYENDVLYGHPKFGEETARWPPGYSWNPKSERVYQRELRGFLTRTTATKILSKKKTVSEDILIERERYNPLKLLPEDILQMMTLHAAAGGKPYTGLDHDSLRTWDWSPLLTLDRAVLIARLAAPHTEWVFDGEVRQPARAHSFVRVLLPVRRLAARSDELRALPKFDKASQDAAAEKQSHKSPNNEPTPETSKP